MDRITSTSLANPQSLAESQLDASIISITSCLEVIQGLQSHQSSTGGEELSSEVIQGIDPEVVLEAGDRALTEMKRIYQTLVDDGELSTAAQLKPSLDLAEQLVGDLNERCGTYTDHDKQVVQSFFSKPAGNVYVDTSNQTSYVQGDHSELLRQCSAYFVSGRYESFGLCRHQNFGGRICDVVFMRKSSAQIAYERGQVPMARRGDSAIKQLIALQNSRVGELHTLFTDKLSDWNYDSFKFYGQREFEAIGKSEETATTCHAVAFFYTPIAK